MIIAWCGHERTPVLAALGAGYCWVIPSGCVLATVRRSRFVRAGKSTPSYTTADGGAIAVEGLDETSWQWAPAYDLTVDDLHTFYVLTSDRNEAILVHNQNQEGELTSRAARREAMRRAGIPTSQQPIEVRRSASGYQYKYRIPDTDSGGKFKIVVITDQTMDEGHPPHWDYGKPKGGGRLDRGGRDRVANPKGNVFYAAKKSC